MDEALLQSEYNYEMNKCVLVQGDIHSVWAYVIDITDNRDEIEFDGFICSRGTLIDNSNEIEAYINHDQGYAPPLLSEYKNEYSIINDLIENDIKIDWKDNIVRILIKGIEYLKMDLDTKMSYAKGISKSGAYGIPLKE
ncbi:hypothetical protein DUT90_01195 [Polaribacter sp. WD7]|uniref:hypothetical protein n=1 Tax=Polaribacter sp. WD7 TaxID=2269061 RepID=UPI000DF1789F|nr:hypothetical protein [Polaribacter sp. WD7]RCS28225.1 hypothetical protein DUT90_01195 [Polaribacter sp. WD7]